MRTIEQPDDIERMLQAWDESHSGGPVVASAEASIRLAIRRRQRRTVVTRTAVLGAVLLGAFVTWRSHAGDSSELRPPVMTERTDNRRGLTPQEIAQTRIPSTNQPGSLADQLAALNEVLDELVADSQDMCSCSWEELADRETSALRAQAEAKVAAQWLAVNVPSFSDNFKSQP